MSSFKPESTSGEKLRIDQLLVQRNLVDSRNKAQTLITDGQILVNHQVISKISQKVCVDADITVLSYSQFVSRAGDKLDHVIKIFQINCQNQICADLGASTGGFTDCLLQHGAQKVYAIDVGYDQLAEKLRTDPRVVVMERCNARYLEALPEPIQMIVTDVSFISMTKLIPAMLQIAAPNAQGILLVKPQFEVGKEKLKDGLVKDPLLRQRCIQKVIEQFTNVGCTLLNQSPSSVPGAKKGNIEELIHIRFPA